MASEAEVLANLMGASKGGAMDFGMVLNPDTLGLLRDEFDVRTEYQGRGMHYGCFGIVAKDFWDLQADILKIIDFADSEDLDEVQNDLRSLLKVKPWTDNMGLNKIYYWPDVEVMDPEEN